MGVQWLGRSAITAAPGPLERFMGLGEVSAPTSVAGPGNLRSEQAAMNRYVRTNGLARFSVSIVADTGSRVLLRPERFNLKSGEWQQANNEMANQLLLMYRGKYTDTQQTLWYHLFHRRSMGERYQVREFNPDSGIVTHTVYGPTAIEPERRGGFRVKDSESDKGRIVAAQDVRRMWRPHPDWPLQPWSALWAGLDDLQRYHLLGRVISRTATSALMARGIIWFPKEGLGREIIHKGKKRRELLAGYYDAANQKLTAEDTSVAAVVPYAMYYGNDFKEPSLIKFDTAFDGNLLGLRAEALESYARSADLPSSLVVNGGPGSAKTGGQSQSNHITDLLVDRRYFDHTVAPELDAVLHWDLTQGFLIPALSAAREAKRFDDDPMLYRIGYDPSPVIIPADKSVNALMAYRTGLLSPTATLEALGFKAEDAPTPGELAKIIETMIAMNQGIRAGDANTKPNGQGPQGTVNANGQGTAVRTST